MSSSPLPSSPASDSPSASDPAWRYGVYLFPIPPLLSLLADAGLVLFVRSVTAETPLIGIAVFFATVVASWTSSLLAAVVAVALPADALALRAHPRWTPKPSLAAGLGLAYLVSAFVPVLYLLSVPGTGYYVYARRRHVRRADHSEDGPDGETVPTERDAGSGSTTESSSETKTGERSSETKTGSRDGRVRQNADSEPSESRRRRDDSGPRT